MYDFLCRNIEKSARPSMLSILTSEEFKFNWVNPTGHWRFDLSSKSQRNLMTQIIAVNNVESEFSRIHSKRGDTSQRVCAVD